MTTPAGRPASLNSLVTYIAVSGVSSDGLMTTVLPVAKAGAIFHANMRRGKFQGTVVNAGLWMKGHKPTDLATNTDRLVKGVGELVLGGLA